MEFLSVTPVLRIFDEAKAREFYVGFLGFTVEFEHRLTPDAPIYMGLARGACRIHLSAHHGDGCPGARLRVQVDDVDALQQQLLAQGYPYARPGIEARPWGARECRVDDGFGNALTFYTPRAL